MKLIKALLLISLVLSFNACDILKAEKDYKDNGIGSNNEEEVALWLQNALTELGLSVLGGVLMDTAAYEELPDTVIVDTARVDTAVVDTVSGDTIVPVSRYRRADLSPYFPKAQTQGQQGSCTGWSSSAILSYYYNASKGYTDELAKKRFSPSFIYNQIYLEDCDGGSYTYLAAELLVNKGDVLLSSFPYDENQCFATPSASILQEASQYRLSEYRRVPKELSQVRFWLDHAVPLLLSIKVDENFFYMSRQNNMFTMNDFSNEAGYHAITMSAYDDSLQAVKLYNSWGTSWGDEGFAWVKYDAFLEMVNEMFVVLE